MVFLMFLHSEFCFPFFWTEQAILFGYFPPGPGHREPLRRVRWAQCRAPVRECGSPGWAARCPQQARPLGDVSAHLSCSDDEDVAPLSAKFADIYPLSNYEDAEVVASMNGVHGELNGGGENLALKDEVHAQPPHRDEEPPQTVSRL